MNLREKETAKTLGVAVQTLRNWRHLRKGPPYIKLGRAIRYRDEDLAAFLEKHRVTPDNDMV
jgi:predicted site-specific integrase-resolvase